MKSALILIDIQNDYFPGGKMELVGAENAGKKAGSMLDAARKNGYLIIHIQHLATRPDAPFFLPETKGAMINDLVKPLPGEDVVQKNFPNSFRETNLQEILTKAGVENLVIGGMMTHMCVDATVRAAADLGYQCMLASDACATRDLIWDGQTVPAEYVHMSFLAALSGLYVQVFSTEDVIRQIKG
ncbi:MAG TPA: cysteine hydrolase family protein [Methanospirillum sp.]|uniref:cysteine hydrolase family protein n=1 Tax=Methanospirillum sp. TaxID=45200 RepID=UPI002BE4E76B|nr:cysteine hydrolase family protein [Methanospirillum sp.]HWQ63940.1 cysteine hydrolase family protein [Methanospirillum sp.]